MTSSRTHFVCGLVLAAGSSRRLGTPKQLLPYDGTTLLDHVLHIGRRCRFDQAVCVVGADHVLGEVDHDGFEVVAEDHDGDGCSSIAAGLSLVDPRADVLVLMLGDQPGVRPATITAVIERLGDAPMAVCAYDNGRGYPLAIARSTFTELSTLHPDTGVWQLIDRLGDALVEVPVAGPVPRDVDTWEDYEAVLEEVRLRPDGWSDLRDAG